MIIAIDGPAAAGKGTLAARLAAHFGLPYLDTGLLYRAVGAKDAGRGLDPGRRGRGRRAWRARSMPARSATRACAATRQARSPRASAFMPRFARRCWPSSAISPNRPGGAVLDGRDIGTAVCPAADVKIYVTASPEVRARRRTAELAAKGRSVDYERILGEIRERDARDSGRAAAPLMMAADAHLLDTTDKDIEAAFRAAVDIIERAKAGRGHAP